MTRLKLTLIALILASPVTSIAQMNRVLTGPKNIPNPLVEKVFLDWFKRKYSEWTKSGRSKQAMAAAHDLCDAGGKENFTALMLHESLSGQLCLITMEDAKLESLFNKYLEGCTELVFTKVFEAGQPADGEELANAMDSLFDKLIQPEWNKCLDRKDQRKSVPSPGASGRGNGSAVREYNF